ncbi:hypothetical protein D3C76_1850670 [compost metagenome]
MGKYAERRAKPGRRNPLAERRIRRASVNGRPIGTARARAEGGVDPNAAYPWKTKLFALYQ